jgi:hypothetical protein
VPKGIVALATAVLIAGISTAAQPAVAAAGKYAPLDRPGPALSVPAAKLRASLACHGLLRNAAKEPVLLNPATGVTPVQNYSWNYERAFDAQRRPWCTVTMPYHTLGNIETAGEYLVHAIRTMHARAGRRVAILGHSQGGMSMRWALRFWPDTRRTVTDVIGMAGSNHGTTVLQNCKTGQTKCPPADWQQGAGARFIRALNSRAETFAHVSYTEIYTHTDEVVQPNGSGNTHASSALHTGHGRITNVATQSICPADVDEHLTVGTIDPVTYALVMDALRHRGPAKPARIDPQVCNQVYQPGVDPSNAQTYLQTLAAAPGLLSVTTPDANIVGAPEVSREPKLRCYVLARGCD